MKKICAIIVTLLLVIPFTVYAATPSVTSLTVSVDATTIKFEGEIEDGSLAYTCRLFADGTEIDKYSGQVNSNKFTGEFVVSKAGEYVVSCTDYEGGTPVEKTATVSVSTEEDTVTAVESPGTFDAIIISVLVLLISSVGIIFGIKYFVKNKQN